MSSSNLTSWDYVAVAAAAFLGFKALSASGAAKYAMIGAAAWLAYGVYQDSMTA